MTDGSFYVRPAFPASPHNREELHLTARQHGLFFRLVEEHAPSVGLTMLSVNDLGGRSCYNAGRALLHSLAIETGIASEDRTVLEQLAKLLLRESQREGVTVARELVPSGCRHPAPQDTIEQEAPRPTTAKDEQLAKFRVAHKVPQEGALVAGSGHRPCRRESCSPSSRVQ